MSQRRRREIGAIRRHLEAIKQAPWMDQARRWWPNHLFHCTDILNVVNILRNGELLSRVQAEETQSLAVDIAGPGIIAQTESQWQDYVRLYFRPRTPTQYRNEGFRPRGQWEYDAHCPVPVYLLFDAISVLSEAESLITDGNLASSCTIPTGSIASFQKIPFNLVYHDTWFDPAEGASIVYHRNAEVLVAKRLGLEAVQMIRCRSQAEYATLLHLLPPGTLGRWVDKIGVQPNLHLFHNKWTFVERVEMSSEHLIFRFNKGTETPGPFDARVEITELPTTSPKHYIWHDEQFQTRPNDVLNIALHRLQNPQDYSVRLLLDQQLGFASRYQEEDLPF